MHYICNPWTCTCCCRRHTSMRRCKTCGPWLSSSDGTSCWQALRCDPPCCTFEQMALGSQHGMARIMEEQLPDFHI